MLDNDHNEAQFIALTIKATAGTPNTPYRCFMQDFRNTNQNMQQ